MAGGVASMSGGNVINDRPFQRTPRFDKPRLEPIRRMPPGVSGAIGDTINSIRNPNVIVPRSGVGIPTNVVDNPTGNIGRTNPAFNSGRNVIGGLGGARSAIMGALPQFTSNPIQTQPLPSPVPPVMSAPLSPSPVPLPVSSVNPMQSINGGGFQGPGIQDFFRQMIQSNPQFLQGLFGNMGGGGKFGSGMNTMAY